MVRFEMNHIYIQTTTHKVKNEVVSISRLKNLNNDKNKIV